MKYEIFFYGSIFVEADSEENAVITATGYLNDNPRHYCEVKEIKEEKENENK